MGSSANIRSLIDTHFLQWCRDNIVIPLDIRREITLPGEPGKEVVIIAVANFSYFATISDCIKKPAAAAGYECQIIEKPQDEIQALLDTAFKEGIISGKSLETSLSDPSNLYL